MSTELTNLLPHDRARALRRGYFLRLATVTFLVLSGIVIVHGLLLMPTYLYSTERAKSAKVQLAGLADSVGSAEEELAKSRSNALRSAVTRTAGLESSISASAAIRAVLAVPRPGITLTGFAVTAPQSEGEPARMRVSGTAITRDALRSYTGALGTRPFVTTADLPISAYARERDIPFTITLSGTLLP